MQKIKEEIAWEGKFIKVVKIHFRTEEGKDFIWEAVMRKNNQKIIAIFAVTKDNELILTKQFRLPQNSYIVELPAGLTDKPDESFEDVARRELLEETGFRADEAVFIHEGPFNSGLNDDILAVYFCPKAILNDVKVRGDDTEEIEVIKVPIDKLVDFCTLKHADFKVDIKILGTMMILREWGLL
jgi:ADP-ribose pyrophosphatase